VGEQLQGLLTTTDHNRDLAGMTYVYPVLSRRAGGVSVGINLNPNHACNWHCVYCQVPDLVRGKAPPIDRVRLATELEGFLAELADGSFFAAHVPEGARQLRDIAFSGNGEPTSAEDFAEIVACVGDIRNAAGHGAEVPLRLITNGSLMGSDRVIAGVEAIARYGGEVWFKIDGGAEQDVLRINGVARRPEQTLAHLARCAAACPTWIQTCLFAWDGQVPGEDFLAAYVDLLRQALSLGVSGLLLYGVARQSMQEEAPRVAPVGADWLEAVAARIQNETGLTVSVSP